MKSDEDALVYISTHCCPSSGQQRRHVYLHSERLITGQSPTILHGNKRQLDLILPSMDEDGRRICEREELLKELKEVGLDAFNRRHCGKTEQRDGALLRALGDKVGRINRDGSALGPLNGENTHSRTSPCRILLLQ